MSNCKKIADRATVLMASVMPSLVDSTMPPERKIALRDAMVKACVKTAYLIEHEVHLRFGDSDVDGDSADSKAYDAT